MIAAYKADAVKEAAGKIGKQIPPRAEARLVMTKIKALHARSSANFGQALKAGITRPWLFSAACKGALGTVAVLFLLGAHSFAQTAGGHGAATQTTGAQTAELELAPGSAQLIAPEDLVKILQSGTAAKPLILNVGPRMLYLQAHIPGAEYIGAGSDPRGIDQLRARVKTLPRDRFIVLYCGCCPWSHCPNVRPAYGELRAMGFTKVKVLYIGDNFGTDWVYKGYPSVKEQ
jgi:rhodanese-related sulfurtransferase